VRTRQFIRTELSYQSSVYFVTDYATAKENITTNEPFVKFFQASKSFFVPILFINTSDSFTIKFHSNLVSHNTAKVNITMIDLKRGSFLNNEKCAKSDLTVKEWIINSEVLFCFAMFACHVQPSGEIEKELIFLMNDQFNRSIIKNFETSNYFKRKSLSFDEFEYKGFCICDYVTTYINECAIEVNDKLSNMYSIISGIILFLTIFVVLHVYDKITKL
jgi:hypothetical protein